MCVRVCVCACVRVICMQCIHMCEGHTFIRIYAHTSMHQYLPTRRAYIYHAHSIPCSPIYDAQAKDDVPYSYLNATDRRKSLKISTPPAFTTPSGIFHAYGLASRRHVPLMRRHTLDVDGCINTQKIEAFS